MDVSTEEAIGCARQLASQEGIMGGMSTGGAGFIALKIAKELEKGVIVFIACDRGDRYLSSELYEKS
jgi:cysteine synthase B